MTWQVDRTDEFDQWWNSLDEAAQDAIDRGVYLLEQFGPMLARPHADHIKQSKHANMKELRTQYQGSPLRTLFAFDPARSAILLIGGDKTGDEDFYNRLVPLADKIFDRHLAELQKKGAK